MRMVAWCLGGAITAVTLAGGPAGAAEYPEMQLRLATVYSDTYVESQALVRFQEAVTEKSGGKITFRYNTGTALGGQNELNDLVSTGGLDMVVHGRPPSAPYLGFFLPYAIADHDHLLRIMQTPMAEEWSNELHRTTGLVSMGAWVRGVRHTIARNPYGSLEDLKGAKIRVPDIPALVAAVESWQANPVIISYAEVYTAVATGAVDGLENTLGSFISDRFYEVAKNVLLTAHATSPVFWVANGDWWDGLSDDTRQLLRTEANEAIAWAVEQNKGLEKGWKEDLESKGVTIRTPANPDAFREAISGFLNSEAEKAWGAEGWKQIQALR